MDCRNFETFAKEFDRMCAYYIKKEYSCMSCPFIELGCYEGTKNNPTKSVEILQQWSNQHPKVTRQDKLLEIIPDTHMRNGVIDICPKGIDTNYIVNCSTQDCCECVKNYWLTEVE